MTSRNLPCEFCDTSEPLVQKRVTVTRQFNGRWYIFEQVPALVCPHCGHRYFEPDVLDAMEAQMETPPNHARTVEALAIVLGQ